METFAERDVCAESRCRISKPYLISHVDREAHGRLRREPRRHIETVLEADLQSTRNIIRLLAIVDLDLEADDVARCNADDQRYRSLDDELRSDVESARGGRECDVRARTRAVDAKLHELVREARRDVTA